MASKSPRSDAPPRDLAEWIAGQRWFGAKSRRIVDVNVADRLLVGEAALLLVRLRLDDGTTPTYVVALRDEASASDAFDDPAFCRALLHLMRAGGRTGHEPGPPAGPPPRASPGPPAPPAGPPPTRPPANTSA